MEVLNGIQWVLKIPKEEPKRLIAEEPKRLFMTKIQHVFHILDTNKQIRNAKELCYALPYYNKATLYNYFRQWRAKKEHSISAFVKDIYTILFILNHKYDGPIKQLSMAEQDSIKRLGELLDKYPDIIEEMEKK